jgi:hypothetical protein
LCLTPDHGSGLCFYLQPLALSQAQSGHSISVRWIVRGYFFDPLLQEWVKGGMWTTMQSGAQRSKSTRGWGEPSMYACPLRASQSSGGDFYTLLFKYSANHRDWNALSCWDKGGS